MGTQTMEYAKMQTTQQPTTTMEPVGYCSCVQHAFPEENDGCVNVRLQGFEQEPSNCTKLCVSQSSFPSGDELAKLLPVHLTRKIQPSACSDISLRLNHRCQRYITGGAHMLFMFLAIFCMFLSMMAVMIWNAAAAANAKGMKRTTAAPTGFSTLCCPCSSCCPPSSGLCGLCVRNPQVDRAMEAECEALSTKSYKLSFTSCNVSLDRKPNPSNMLKYVTVRVIDDVC